MVRVRGLLATALLLTSHTLLTLRQNRLQHPVEVLEDVGVDEADQSEPFIDQRTRPPFIVSLPALVRLAVQLDDQPRLRAVVIGDVTPNRVLPAELEAIEPAVAQAPPQLLLGGRGLLAHFFGAAPQQLRVDPVGAKAVLLVGLHCGLTRFRKGPSPQPSPLGTGERGKDGPATIPSPLYSGERAGVRGSFLFRDRLERRIDD